MISFRHILETNNTGDDVSGPYHYFDFPEFDVANYTEPPDPSAAAVVYGGGTMTNWLQHRREVPSMPRIGWGIGSSRHGAIDPWPDPKGFTLLGVREWSPEREAAGIYLPCASCMSPLFDRDYEITREVALFVNADSSIAVRYPVNIGWMQYMKNDAPMADIVAFIGETETIVTNSYHGIIWATWLGRRVVALPYSSKFYGLKYPPGYSRNGGLDWKEARPASGYESALEDSRALNRAFFERVMEVAA